MPHDVIMPALGMAQDTGLIVSWLKQSGDAVKTGDALMEVETDKAVMEVEAPADGFLTDIRAKAGEDVPVGQVIAVINDTADVPSTAPTQASEPSEQAPSDAMPTGESVIMPALGMAQDTGIIVAWHKAPGDAVSADDVLFEVETDKATMEVAAGHDGFVAALLCDAGQDIPVGDVVAVISAEKPDAPISRAASSKAAPPPKAKAEETPKTSADPPRPIQQAAANGTILASPKARRLALEQGLDLGRLAASGHPQPFHVADLEVLRNMPADPAPGHRVPTVERQITARVSATAWHDFAAWLAQDTGAAPPRATVWAGFACGALRTAIGPTSITVEVTGLSGDARRLDNPDQPTLPAKAEGSAPDLALHDLTGSAITGLRLGASDVPVLTVTQEGEHLVIALDFASDHLSNGEAIALITGFADRLADPTRHLL